MGVVVQVSTIFYSGIQLNAFISDVKFSGTYVYQEKKMDLITRLHIEI